MNYFYLFLVTGLVMVVLIIIYDAQNKKKVTDILRANKNVPPLFMLRSAELKINAMRATLNAPVSGDAAMEELRMHLAGQLEKIMASYKNREIPLTAYYAKLGALMISVNRLKASVAEAMEHATA
jgi:hypothetical protein